MTQEKLLPVRELCLQSEPKSFYEKDFGYFFWNYTVSENMRNNCVFPYNML